MLTVKLTKIRLTDPKTMGPSPVATLKDTKLRRKQDVVEGAALDGRSQIESARGVPGCGSVRQARGHLN